MRTHRLLGDGREGELVEQERRQAKSESSDKAKVANQKACDNDHTAASTTKADANKPTKANVKGTESDNDKGQARL